MGIFGLLFYLALWFGLIWKGVQNLKVRNDNLFMINAAALAVLVGLLFDGFLSFSLRVNQPQRLFFMAGAFIMAVYYMRNLKNQNESTCDKPRL